jgi:large subunit ribosomal protein L22
VAEALMTPWLFLEHTPKRAALPLIKVIKSAKANAGNNHNVKTDNLMIKDLHVSPGPRGNDSAL